MTPVFLYLLKDGSLWVGKEPNDLSTANQANVVASWRINGLPHKQKIGQVTGTTGNYAATGDLGVLVEVL
jgi:hypothetical protein